MRDFFSFFHKMMVDEKDFISSTSSILTIIALMFAWRQISEAQKQRNVSESISLYKEMDAALAEWSSSTRKTDQDSRNFQKSVGRTLSLYEIAAGAINKKSLPPLANDLMHGLIRDGLTMMCRHQRTREAISYSCHHPSTYKALRKFLTRNFKLISSCDKFENTYAALFPKFAPEITSSKNADGKVFRFLIGIRLTLLGRL